MNNANDYIAGMLRQIGITEYENLAPNRWAIQLPLDSSETEDFTVEIYIKDGWVSLTSMVMKNLRGSKLPQFYELLFQLSHYLNGFKLGMTADGEYISLQAEVSAKHLDFIGLNNILLQFGSFYLNYYPKIIEIADQFRLKFRKGVQKRRDVDDMWKKLIGNSNVAQLPKSTGR